MHWQQFEVNDVRSKTPEFYAPSTTLTSPERKSKILSFSSVHSLCFQMSHSEKGETFSFASTLTFLWPLESAWIRECFYNFRLCFPPTPAVRELCQWRQVRGDCEFYVMINGVFKRVFRPSYLRPRLNCSLFPGLWMLECHRIIWDVPLTEEGGTLFIHALASVFLFGSIGKGT